MMIESWTVSNNESVAKEAHFNPMLPNMNVKNDRYGRDFSGPSKNDYIEYSWLFGKR
jgi:hypothetical protein